MPHSMEHWKLRDFGAAATEDFFISYNCEDKVWAEWNCGDPYQSRIHSSIQWWEFRRVSNFDYSGAAGVRIFCSCAAMALHSKTYVCFSRPMVGALVLMTYRGVRHASPEVNARIARGEPVDAAEHYLRTAPFFETASPNYSWINKIVAVGVGERRSDTVVYEVFEIL